MSKWTEIHARRRLQGFCPSCGKRKPKRGRVSCAKCIKAAGSRRQRCVDAGLCVDCRAPTGGTRRCYLCQLTHQTEKTARARARPPPEP